MSDASAVDPEEALIASAAACHMLWFLSLAQAKGLDILSYEDSAEGRMGKGADGRIAITRIVLRPKVAFVGAPPAPEMLERLHHEAHERCFIANTLKSEIVIEPA